MHMTRISQAKLEATRLGLRCDLISGDALVRLVARLAENLRIDFSRSRAWDNAQTDCVAVQHQSGWEAIAQYVGERPCYLLSSDYSEALTLASGSDLQLTLAETPPFEFYVFDPRCDWLLCFNDHDFLIGWGRAAPWVEGLPSSCAH